MRIIILILLWLLFPTVSHADIWSGLIGRWSFDEASSGICSGTSIIDSSPSASNGTCNNSPVWINGKIGQGALFLTPVAGGTNGTASPYVDIANEAKYDNWPTMSWAGWYYQLANGTYTSIILEKSEAYRVMCNNGQVVIAVSTNNNGWYVGGGVVWGTGTGSLNAWHHFVFTYDGSNLREYLDGVFTAEDTTAISGNIKRTIGVDLRLGYSEAANTSFFNGYMDDIRIYNRALTAADVLQLYQYGIVSLNHSTWKNFKLY